MIKNYFLIAIRNIKRYKAYALINILGLAVGIAACSLIYLFVQHETSYDHFHTNSERIVRASMTWKFNETELPSASATTIVGPMLEEKFPEILSHVRLYNNDLTLVKASNKPFEERGFLYADSTLFEIFSFELILGNPKVALNQPYSVVLSQSMAEKYFGMNWEKEEVLGKMVRINDKQDYQVTGIIENAPDNSQIQYNFLASFSSLPGAKKPNWDTSAYYTYLLLQSGADIQQLKAKIDEAIKADSEGEEFVEVHLEKFTDVYLHSSMSSGIGPNSDIKYIYLFTAIGFFILLIACINYMNLATARSIERAKEVGLRKVFGAIRSQLVGQFMGESVVFTFLGLIISFVLVWVFLPAFNALTGKELTFNPFTNVTLLLMLLMIAAVVSVLAGSYPAIALSRFKPISVLRGKFRNSSTGNMIRQGLVVFQFCISIILLVGTLFVYRQLDYMQQKKLGYDQDHVVILPLDNVMSPKVEELKTAIAKVAGVSTSAAVSHVPGSVRWESTFGVVGSPDRSLLVTWKGDEGLIPTLDLNLLTGNNLSDTERQSKTYEFLINETAASFWGWEIEEAVGKRITIFNQQEGVIKGVLKDFNFASLHDAVKPLVIFTNERVSFRRQLLVKMDGKRVKEALKDIEAIWDVRAPHRPFTYHFLDEQFDNLYKSEQKLSEILSVFTGLAIFIACLGLFGLASFTATLKAKEIGIRKILGASVTQIVLLFSNNYTRLILVAILIASPITYFAMDEWLSNFSYRIDMNIWPFVLSGMLALLIAWATVAYQSVKAAMADPIEALRDE